MVLAVPALRAGWSMTLAGAFLAEFLSGGRHRALSRITSEPMVAPLAVPGVAVDVFARRGASAGAPMVLIHGVTSEGKDDPRLREAAALLARTGFDVAVPTIPGLTRGRLRPADVEPVVAIIRRQPRPTTVVAVSIGAGPALLAAADPRVRSQVATVVTLGGYASARELVRFFLTGEYAYGDIRGRTLHDPEVVRMFVAANADAVSEDVRRALATEDPPTVARALETLAPDVKRMLDELSPDRVAPQISARLLLVHGRADPAVPYTETLRLAAAAGPGRASVALVGVVGHVEGVPGREAGRAARDVLALWWITYAMIAGR